MRLALLVVLFMAVPLSVLAGLGSGGGVRKGDGVQVHDALGLAVAGVASGDGVRVSTGLVFGIGIPVPVDLLAFHISASAQGVTVAWTAPDDAAIGQFTLERNVPGSQDSPDAFTRIGPVFPGSGPHRYTDTDLHPGETVSYRLTARLRSGEFEHLGPWTVTHPESGALLIARVLPARPNPFRGSFTLAFELPEPGSVRWRVMDIQGALVTETDLGYHDRGAHAVAVHLPDDAAHGIYFLEVITGGRRDVQKVVRLP